MKLIAKSLAALAAFAFSHSAMANNNVYLTGSTAFRAAIMVELQTAGAVFDAAPAEIYVGSSSTGATYSIFFGNVNSVPTYVKTSWTGSTGGWYLVSHQGTAVAPFLADSFETQLGVAGSKNQISLTSASSPSTTTPGGADADFHSSDMGLADCFQASATASHGNTPSTQNDQKVAIVTFYIAGNYSMCINEAHGTPITNVSIQQLKSLFQGTKEATAGQFTGAVSGADTTILVLPMGRDFDSGTRVTFMADTGLGVSNSPYQWQPAVGPGTNDFIGFPAANDVPSATGGGNDTAFLAVRQWWDQDDGTGLYANYPGNLTGSAQSYKLYGTTPTNGILTVNTGDGGFQSGGNLAKVFRLSSCQSAFLTDLNNNTIPDYSLSNNSSTATGVYAITPLGTADSTNLFDPQAANALTLTATFTSGAYTCTVPSGTLGTTNADGSPKLPIGCQVTSANLNSVETVQVTGYTLNTGGGNDTINLSRPATATGAASLITKTQTIGVGPGIALKYNGYLFSPQAVASGQYSEWGYEHLYWNNNLTTQGGLVQTRLQAALLSTSTGDQSLAGAGLKYSTALTYNRGGDGAYVAVTYF